MTKPIPNAGNLSKTEELLQNIRQTPLFRQLIPQEAGIGLPIPLRKQGKVYAILPCFGFTPSEKGKTAIFPPFAIITIDWQNQIPVEYVNLRFRYPETEFKWDAQVGIFPHPSVAEMTIGEYKEKRREVLVMYDKMFENLESDASFSSEWINEFSELLNTLIEPSLVPYYRIFGSKFCERFLAKS